ncbi:MAG: sel1 repeat family protein [gamma proteobacterium symbiont of Taylorina sp.]|nr:sel1 repeat family protein [gamma proteobacterium symbiont of Taylorina sp.]
MRNSLTLILVFFFLTACATNNKSLFIEIESLAKQGSPEAQYHLGMFYNNGIGTQKNTAKAFEWFEKSALTGDPLGYYKLGCYYAGQGQEFIAIDSDKALEYKLIAAHKGYSFAQSDVASTYFESGEIDEAVKWWKSAANQGDAQSFYILYELYSKGIRIPRDAILSYRYLKIIERNSSTDQKLIIAEKLIALEKEMTDMQLIESNDFVIKWAAEQTPLTLKGINGLETSKQLVNKKNGK